MTDITNPTLAYNLLSPVDWTVEQPFINWMKFCRPFFANGTSSANGATTNSAGYALGIATVTLASAGAGSLPVGTIIQFNNDPANTKYRITSGDGDVSNGGSITFTPGLLLAIPASATGITVVTFSAYSHAELKAGGYVDSNGYPTALPPAMVNFAVGWYSDGEWQQGAYDYRKGNYVLTYDGTPTISVGGDSLTVTSQTAGRIAFTNIGGGSMYVLISAIGGGVSNMKLLQERFVAMEATGEQFNPDWLPYVQYVRQVRTMAWQFTNNATITTWANRIPPSYHSYQFQPGGGVPPEVICQFCNQIGADAYMCIPHTVDDDYVTQFATVVKNTLNTALVAYFEYSNEIWNFAFDQNDYCREHAILDWGEGNEEDWQAKRATQVAILINNVFTGQSSRVANVLGIQNGDVYSLQHRYSGEIWQAHDPGGFTDPYSVLLNVAVTSYFGSLVIQSAVLGNQVLSQIAALGTNGAMAWFATELNTPGYADSIPVIAGLWSDVNTFLNTKGLNLILYEGGQHVQHSAYNGGITNIPALASFLSAFCQSTYMATLYQQLWDAWKLIGDGPFMQFNDFGSTGTTSQSNSFGLYEYIGYSDPRSALLVTLNAAQVSWFGDGGGTRYIPQTVETISDSGGTVTMSARGGYVAGGTGHNIVQLPGVPADYTLTFNANSSYTATKSGFSATMSSVQVIN